MASAKLSSSLRASGIRLIGQIRSRSHALLWALRTLDESAGKPKGNSVAEIDPAGNQASIDIIDDFQTPSGVLATVECHAVTARPFKMSQKVHEPRPPRSLATMEATTHFYPSSERQKSRNKKSFRRQRACDIEIALALRLQARS